MAHALPNLDVLAFSACKGKTRIEKSLPVTRENVYHVRWLVRVYSRKGYHVHAAINHNGRLFCNVFGANQYAIAKKREEARAASNIILEHIEACDRNIDDAIKYRDKYFLRRLQSEHVALWRVLLNIDRAAAMRYRDRKENIERARRLHGLIK